MEITADETAKLHRLGALEVRQLEDRKAIATAIRLVLDKIEA
jgi:hypothetical protein